MTISSRGSEPFTPEVSTATNRKVSPFFGRTAPEEWFQVPQRTPSSSAPVRVLDRVALQAELRGGVVETHHGGLRALR
jgi:hypothetical protein